MTDDNANLIAGTAPTKNTVLVSGANYQTVPLTGLQIWGWCECHGAPTVSP